MSQQIVWNISLVLMAMVAIGFLFVAINSGHREVNYAPLQRRAYKLRFGLFLILALVFGSAMLFTLRDVPYDASKTRSTSAPQIINATGQMWRWELSQNRVSLNRPVEFHVTSVDVNHGFGIYGPDMILVGQTQAMPGYTNTVRHTFTRPGVYKIMCLEYCGLAHHKMMSEFTVDAE